MSNFSQFLPTTNLTSGVTGTLPVANGGTGAATLTANNVLLGNGTSALQAVAPGTTGNVLTSNGTTWASTAPAGGGSWTFLSTVTASNSATADLVSTFNSTYDNYAIVFNSVTCANFNEVLCIRLRIDGTYNTSNYSFSFGTSGSTYSGLLENAGSLIMMHNSSTPVPSDGSNKQAAGILYVPSPSNTTKQKSLYGDILSSEANTRKTFFAGNYNASLSALTGVRFLLLSGNNFSGTFRLYGIKNS